MKTQAFPVDYRKLLLPPTATIKQAIEVMSGAEGAGIALITGKNTRLLGIVVDSDIRKGILRGLSLDAPLSAIMNQKPVTLAWDSTREAIIRFFQETPRASIPLIDKSRRIHGLAQMAAYLTQASERPNWVVLMVGGAGKRLHPLTVDNPKPLLPVGNKPILETIVEQFVEAGFKKFVFTIYHHSDKIRAHFGDGRRFGADIRYIQEAKSLGTAGPLSLLGKIPQIPLIVMNGDLLTKVDFLNLLDFHREEKAAATMCVREYDFQVPYGVIEMEEHRLIKIVEKPTHRFFVNAGIYVLEPAILKLIPKGKALGMPDLLDKVRRKWKRSVACFPIREYWMDIGQIHDYEKAQSDYSRVFQ